MLYGGVPPVTNRVTTPLEDSGVDELIALHSTPKGNNVIILQLFPLKSPILPSCSAYSFPTCVVFIVKITIVPS